MSSWRNMLSAVVTDLKAVIGTQSPSYTIAVGWPPLALLQGVATAGANSVISVYDQGPARDTTRWMPFILGNVIVPAAGITTVIANPFIGPSASTTLTITGTPSFADGDAASFILGQGLLGNTNAGVVYITHSADTLNTFTAGLAAAITAAFSAKVTATAVANVITITNITSGNLTLSSNVGAGATLQQEVRRAMRSVGIHVWAQTPTIRDTLGDIIEGRLATLQATFGYNFSDGTWGRVTFQSDVNIEDDILQDVYRRDFMIGIDYGVTVADQVYTVLLTQNNITAEPAG